MALAEYSDLFWYPSGQLATGVLVRIFPHDSNVLAPLFTDATGTVPLANPLTTSATGTIEFWAETGLYWMHADSESFEIAVGLDPNDPDAIEELQSAVLQLQGDVAATETDIVELQGDVVAAEADIVGLQADVVQAQQAAASTLSTGVAGGGDLSVNAVSPSAVDIAPLVGYVTSFDVDPLNPVITRIDYPGGTVEMDAGALARTVTAWLMDVNQNIIQQATLPTNAQRRELIYLGVTAQVGGAIIVDQTLPVILQQPANQLTDLITAMGAFNISGNVITANGANLMINQSAGTLFSQAFNHYVGPVQTNDPHVATTIAQAPASFRYITSTGTVFGALRTTLDVANYDLNGVVTPVGGGAGSSTIHRVYLFPNNTASDQIVIHYGQTVYSSLAAATARIGASSTFTPNQLTRGAALIAYIAATRTATDLSDPSQAAIVTAGKFASP